MGNVVTGFFYCVPKNENCFDRFVSCVPKNGNGLTSSLRVCAFNWKWFDRPFYCVPKIEIFKESCF